MKSHLVQRLYSIKSICFLQGQIGSLNVDVIGMIDPHLKNEVVMCVHVWCVCVCVYLSMCGEVFGLRLEGSGS